MRTLTAEQYLRARGFILDNYYESESYKIRNTPGASISPFLQGDRAPCEDDADGWLFIEFWAAREPAQIETIKKWLEALNRATFGPHSPRCPLSFSCEICQ